MGEEERHINRRVDARGRKKGCERCVCESGRVCVYPLSFGTETMGRVSVYPGACVHLNHCNETIGLMFDRARASESLRN